MKIRTKLTIGFSLIAMIVLIIGVFTSYNFTKVGEQFNYLIEHDLHVLQNAEELHKLVVDAETGQRGYVITGSSEFLEPYNNALSNFDLLYDKEITLVSDNSPQVARLSRIRSLFYKWQEVAAIPEINARRDSTFNYARELVQNGTGKTVLDQIRSEFKKFIQIENNLEQIRRVEAQEIEQITKLTVLFGTLIILLLLLVVAVVFLNSFTPAIANLRNASDKIAQGDLTIQIPIIGDDEITELAHSFNNMASNVRHSSKINKNSLWLQSEIASISDKFSGDFEITEMTETILSQLVLILDAQIGTFHLHQNNELNLISSYGLGLKSSIKNTTLEEGLIGQVSLSKKPYLLNNIPKNYPKVNSSVISIQPNSIAIAPVIFENKVLGVIEIASIKSISDLQFDLLVEISNRVGTAISLAQSREKLRLNQDELKIINQLLESQNKELEHFAYIVSHDLKAPLSAITSLTAFIDEDLRANKNEEVYSHLDLLNGRIKRMENLIEGILNFSKIGMVKSKKELINIDNLVHEIYHNLNAPEQFELQIANSLPSIIGVRTLYIQIFTNIISNSIKYNDKTKGLINITYKDLRHSHEFSISDNGPGIQEKFHEKVFVAFQTLNSRDSIESTGIGLSIVQKIITLLNGAIRIESGEKEGVKFILVIPKMRKTNL